MPARIVIRVHLRAESCFDPAPELGGVAPDGRSAKLWQSELSGRNWATRLRTEGEPTIENGGQWCSLSGSRLSKQRWASLDGSSSGRGFRGNFRRRHHGRRHETSLCFRAAVSLRLDSERGGRVRLRGHFSKLRARSAATRWHVKGGEFEAAEHARDRILRAQAGQEYKNSVMAYWLFKTEPSDYSIADLARDGQTNWTGVNNAMARLHLRKVRGKDRILIYHTGQEKSVVGEMRATGDAVVDGKEKSSAVSVEVAYVKTFTTPVAISQIRKLPDLANWDLVRNSRLSVMPVTPAQWKRVVQLAGG